jgi:hypothetical protein
MSPHRKRRSKVRSLFTAVSIGLLLAALVRELRTPKGRRDWQGRVAGIPYDLRPPTPSRLRAAYWNPDDPRLFPPRPAGVGWAVNVARLVPSRS